MHYTAFNFGDHVFFFSVGSMAPRGPWS